MTDQPLHVQVGEALGCHPVFSSEYEAWMCPDGKHGYDGGAGHLAHYDTDWDVTGPLIEEYGIWIMDLGDMSEKARPNDVERWAAVKRENAPHFYDVAGLGIDGSASDPYEYGETPLLAVCRLLIALADKEKAKVQG